ncbi:MAG: Digeranylgeranylglycerophospholipid reductase [Candidatus Heimdallarchaeota archaeon LC_3]|nr:MAG: Digeranylgeranylglycerophospholipid reductase [Candidatus Heimdallarchaeota archaeon LC_3]
MEKECDVLVVGGGPAGVIASYVAVKEGKSVYLTDTKIYEQIGNKTCGDALSLEHTEFLKEKTGIDHPTGKEVSDTIDTLILATEKIELPINLPGYVVDRHIYGQRLLKIAELEGVSILPQMKALRSYIKGETVIGAYFKNLETKKEEIIKSKVTIDCSGASFILRKTLPKGRFRKIETNLLQDEIVPSYREIIRLRDDHPYHNKIYLIYDNSIPQPGYFWFFSKGKNELNAGIGWKLSKDEKGNSMRKVYREILHKYYSPDSYEILDGRGYIIPLRYPLLNHVANGFLTAGDAACHVDPSTAEGHGPALVAGYFAGLQASQAIEGGEATTERLWNYNKNIFMNFGLNHLKKQLLTDVITSIKMEGVDFIFKRKILTTEEFSNISEGGNLNILSILEKIIRSSPHWGYLFKLRTFSKGMKILPDFFNRYPSSPHSYNSWLNEFFPWYQSIRNKIL